ASCAAYGVLLREPLKPATPPLAHATVFPFGSVIVISVLLNVDDTYARPRGMFLRSRRRPRCVCCRARPIPNRLLLLRYRELAAEGYRLLLGGLLLAGHRALGAAARTGVGLRPLAAHRQTAAVPLTPVAV